MSAAGLRSSSCFPDPGIEGQAQAMRSTQEPISTELLKHQVWMPNRIGSRMRRRTACRSVRYRQVRTGALHVGFRVPCHSHMLMTSSVTNAQVCILV